MIKQELRSTVFNLLPKLDKTSKYHQRFLDAVIERTISEMYWELYALDAHALQRYTVTYGRTVPVTVSYEASTQLYYSTLPAKIVPMPDKASGVRRIHTVRQLGIRFFPMDFREMDLIISSSYYKTVTDKILYAVDQTRIEYHGMTAAIAATGVRMDIIQPFSQYADGDTVLIPEFRDGEGMSFEERVLKKLSVIPPVNLSEDTDEPIKANQ